MENSRFKFRVWDSLDRKYLDAPAVWLSSDGYAHEVDCELSTIDYAIEQCTGLTDKNGKLIYEGDVLRFNGIFIDCCVIFRNGAFEYALCEDDKISYRLTEVIAKSTQIIGNVHEMEQKQ